MERIVCDTSTVSAIMRGTHPEHMADWQDAVKLISIVTVAELHAGAVSAEWGVRRRAELQQTINAYPQVPIDDQTTLTWADLRASCRRRGVAIGDNDLWIAATGIRLQVPVASLDGDFARVEGLDLIDASGRMRTV